MFTARDVACMLRQNEAMRKTFQVVEDTLDANPCVTAVAMERVLRAQLPQFYGDSGTFPLSFPEANALDDYFFRVGRTHFWRKAYNYPEKGNLPTQARVRAMDVGMFTFNIES